VPGVITWDYHIIVQQPLIKPPLNSSTIDERIATQR
jgi:hypothetical protein